MSYEEYKAKILSDLNMYLWYTVTEVAHILDKKEYQARAVLSEMEEEGLVEVDETKKPFQYRIVRREK